MIKFFRRIRYHLMGENKMGKYFKYAVGEIFLVVIGILIALQINNWNTAYKDRKLEHKTLSNLKLDLSLQKGIIQDHLLHERMLLLKVDSCLSMIHSKIKVDRLVVLLDTLADRLTFVTNSVTFDHMGLEGNASNMTNVDLQKKLLEYYQQLDYTKSVVNNNNLYRTNSQFGAFIVNNPMGLELNENGLIDTMQEISPKQKYTLKKQLEARKYSLLNNIEKCSLQMIKTEELFKLVEEELMNN